MAQAIAEAIIRFLGAVPDAVKVFVLSLAPVTEYKLAIILGLTRFHLSPMVVYLSATLGSVCVFLPLFFGLEAVRKLLAKASPTLVRPLDIFLEHVERKTKHHYAQYGAVVLFVFAALPIPLTGVWSATVAAVIFKIPFKTSAIAILLGALLGQLIVLLSTMFVS